MLGVLGLIPGLFTLVGQFLGVKKAQVDAAGNAVTQAGQVQTAEMSPINALIRAMISIGPACYLLKVFLWDKVLGLGVTDPLSPALNDTLIAVVGFYLLHITVGRRA